MDLRLWFLFLLSSISSTVLCSPKTVSPGSTPRSAQPIVYTAETARQLDPPYPSQSSPQTTDPYGSSATGASVDIPEDTGFVEPIDFNAFISNAAFEPKRSSVSSPFASESKSKDAFPDFFKNNGRSTESSYFEPSFGALSSSASSQSARKPQEDSEDGFVDPSVQFRSLFDSTETADGFRPQDFLNYKGESVGAEPSKGAQTRSYPSYTYTGRQNGEDDESPTSSPKYRSSYRQVDSREQNRDPYDDRNYYDGERDESPPPPRPPPRRYQTQGNNYNQGPRNSGESSSYAPTGQETAHAPQASNNKPKGAEATSGSGKNGKCKKVEKVVDDEEEYADYNNPGGDYDPSTYDSRYKRQSGSGRSGRSGNKKGNKKPMTCYVCEDEQGRYAERCSYDSNSDPNKGSYFHSSSTVFNDNGNRRGNRGGRERNKRNPSITASASVLTATTVPSATESLPKKIEKRQSQGNRYASDFRDDREGRRTIPNQYDNNEDFDRPSYGGGHSNERDQDRNTNDYEGPPLYGEHRGSTERARAPNNRDEDNNDYGFAPPTPRRNNRPRGQNNEFEFGPPTDFGRDAGEDSKGFEFDFSVPKDFQSDISNLGTSNTNNRPIFAGTNSGDYGSGSDNGFDVGYDDYIKKYFPDAFGSTPGPSAASSHRPSGVSSSPERHYSPGGNRGPPGPPAYHGGRPGPPGPSYNHGGPSHDKESTHPSHNFSPPPYFDGPEESPEHLQAVISTFDQKDRRDCQKVLKGDMTCYVCRDARGMNKEECMYKSKDPRNTQMAYHEVSEYSSLPPASILPLPRPKLASAESKIKEVKKSPLDYDFDY